MRATGPHDRTMEILQGTTTDPLHVGEDLFVSGSVDGGAVVEDGRSLYIRGGLNGSIAVGRGAQVLVHGRFDGWVDANLGSILVVGDVATPLELLSGDLDVTAGTTVSFNGERRMVAADGELLELASAVLRPASAGQLLRWLPDTRTFQPTAPSLAQGFLAGLVARYGTGPH
jgi:hypothetical protein